jgi:hypothetical protein
VADGVVTKIDYQSASNDYEIATRLSDTSQWRIYYDHVVNVNPAVTIGANIKAGDNLGTAGNFTPPRTDYSRTEFHVNYFITIDPFNQSYNCPMLFLDPSIADTLKTQVLQLMRDWEAFKGSSSLYDDDAMGSVAPGCMKKSYLENEL